MSQRDVASPAERLEKPSRRQALFTARDMLLAAATTPALPLLAQPVAPAALRVMHGFADQQGLALWLQGSRAQALSVEIRAAGATGKPLQAYDVPLTARTDFTETLFIAGLDPGTRYQYAVRDGKAVAASGAFATQPLWQYRTDPPTVRIAAGSCAYMNDGRFDRPGKPYGGGEEIFDAIADTRPDLMLWLGDNIYLRDPEYTSREGINRRYRFHRGHPRMQKLWTAAPNVAIWDDHDFGPNNSDFSYAGRGWTLEMFRRYWPLAYDPPADGLYGKVLQGDVDLFLLDDRSYRFPERWPDTAADKVMYGAKQMLWLKAALTFSRAPFKIVCGGSQFFNRATRVDNWTRYGAEQQEFLRFLEERRIPGVLFLSGDRHFAQHLTVRREGLYALNEITTSPLTSSPPSNLAEAERANPDMAPGSLYVDRNFALVTVTGPQRSRALSIELRNTQGAKVWEWQTTAAELAAGTRPA